MYHKLRKKALRDVKHEKSKIFLNYKTALSPWPSGEEVIYAG